MLIVTTDQIPGRTIDTVIGEVVGLTARTLNPFSEGVKRVDGRPAREVVPSLLRWRKDAIAHMATEAKSLGADAVIGMKFDNRILSSSWTEICAYGTAVTLVPLGVHPGFGRARLPSPYVAPLPADAMWRAPGGTGVAASGFDPSGGGATGDGT